MIKGPLPVGKAEGKGPCIWDVILNANRNQTIYVAGFAPYFVASLANISPLFAAESASSDPNPSPISLSFSY